MNDIYLETHPAEIETFLAIYRNYKIARMDAVEKKRLTATSENCNPCLLPQCYLCFV